ncbi:MAG: endonuclease, partial [Bacteroidales bacterium]
MNRFLLLLLLLISLSDIIFAQNQKLRVIFYNTENLFDHRDDPEKDDNEFLPSATRRWSFYRYRQKLIQLSKVLVAAGDGEIPALIGLCEVENDSVMQDLF